MRPALVLFFVVVAAPRAAVGQGAFEQFLDEDGVKGYARAIPGSRIQEVRSTIVLPARIEVVGAVLRDVEGLARPGADCSEARYLERLDRDRYAIYVAYDLTWPVSNRDAVIQVRNRYDLDRGRVISRLRAVSDPRVPPRKGFTRITDLTAEFVVEYITREKTAVIYTSRTDPGGSIPTWLVNRGNKSTLRQSARDLREAVKKPEYLRKGAASPDGALAAKLTTDPRLVARVYGNRLGELIRDRELRTLLLGDRGVENWLRSGELGEILVHGWGSQQSRRQAVAAVLRRFLAGRTSDGAAIARFLSGERLDRILRGAGGLAEVKAWLDGLSKGKQGSP
jgi:hypothetical protein